MLLANQNVSHKVSFVEPSRFLSDPMHADSHRLTCSVKQQSND